jgi:predicted O-methyltransferase YrrM
MTLPTVSITPKWDTFTSRMYMQPGEIEVLLTLVNSVKPTLMLEIGVNEGRTALAVLKTIPTIERYIGLDAPVGYQFGIAAQQVEQPTAPAHMVMHDPRFKLILRGDDTAITGPFDVAFIDGDHSYKWVKRDYRLARRTVRSGGIIIFHDYGNGAVQVAEALHEIHAYGNKLYHVNGTWLAYERLP